MGALRGFGMTFDCATGGFRNWYLDGEGCKRWADNDEIVRGLNGLQDEPPPQLRRGRRVMANNQERSMFELIESDGAPIKAWTRGVHVEEVAKQQLRNLAGMPFIHKHIAAMPDVHWGMGATVGSVIATKGAIIPAAVGVDIGCGMMAQRTTLTASDLPDNLLALRTAIESRIPHGRTNNGTAGENQNE